MSRIIGITIMLGLYQFSGQLGWHDGPILGRAQTQAVCANLGNLTGIEC